MSLAEVTARLAGELAALRAEHAALRRELDRATATIVARDRRIGELGVEFDTARRVVELTARRLEMAELAQAEAERGIGAARAAADTLRVERDEVRRLAHALAAQLGSLEGALAGSLRRRLCLPCITGLRSERGLVVVVALGLRRRALPAIVRMVRAEATHTPLLLVVDRDLNDALDPAPATWLRLPSLRELPRNLAMSREGYLQSRLVTLVEALRPVTAVALGPFAAELLRRKGQASQAASAGRLKA